MIFQHRVGSGDKIQYYRRGTVASKFTAKLEEQRLQSTEWKGAFRIQIKVQF